VPHANRKIPDIKFFAEIYQQYVPVLFQDMYYNLSSQKGTKVEAKMFQQFF
jgi:hypothetical protein